MSEFMNQIWPQLIYIFGADPMPGSWPPAQAATYAALIVGIATFLIMRSIKKCTA